MVRFTSVIFIALLTGITQGITIIGQVVLGQKIELNFGEIALPVAAA